MAAKKVSSISKAKDPMELEVRIRVLEKLTDKLIGAIMQVAVAQKTADKALAMAQESMVIVTSGMQYQQAQAEQDEFSVPPGMDGSVPKPGQKPAEKELDELAKEAGMI